MSEETPVQKTERKDPYVGVRRAFMALGVLFILWLAFGRVIPHYVFGEPLKPAKSFMEPARPALPPPPCPDHVERIDALEERVTQLEAQLSTYQELVVNPVPPAAAQPDSDGTALDEWKAEIEAKIEQLKQAAPDQQVQQERFDTIEKRVQDSEQRVSSTVASLIAYGQLQDAFQRGESWDAPLKTLSGLTAGNSTAQKQILELQDISQRNKATMASLQHSFSSFVSKALRTHKDTSWTGNLGSLVRIRKVGEQQVGTDDESVLARAEAKLERAELEACLKELSQLSPPAASEFSAWVQEAETFLRTRAILARLEATLSPSDTTKTEVQSE